jgi:hypothetical protein
MMRRSPACVCSFSRLQFQLLDARRRQVEIALGREGAVVRRHDTGESNEKGRAKKSFHGSLAEGGPDIRYAGTTIGCNSGPQGLNRPRPKGRTPRDSPLGFFRCQIASFTQIRRRSA